MRMAALAAIVAYVFWGTFGLYFKALDNIAAPEILAHRITWSLAFLSVIVFAKKLWHEVLTILLNPKKLAIFIVSAILISINWGIFIYSIVSGQALEGSMGYFIMPLVAVILGGVFFGEKFSTPQSIAILLALSGVGYQVWVYGKLPWIALTLATTFGFYGMLRKKAPADSVVGLFVETLLITPFAVVYMAYLYTNGAFQFLNADLTEQAFLLIAGPITAIPLILFTFGARKLRYSTAGLLQYINPTCQFLVAIFLFKEEFDVQNLITFGLIWAGLALYSQNTLMQSRRNKASHS